MSNGEYKVITSSFYIGKKSLINSLH